MNFGLSALASIAFRIGVVGGLILTFGMVFMRAIEPTPINFELALGSLMTRSFDPLTWVLGFGMHIFLCGALAIVYAKAFEAVNRFGMGIGAVFGILHWAVVGLAMGFLPDMFSMVPELFGPPGFFGVQFGGITVAGLCLLHIIFGAAVGSFYESARERLAMRAPQIGEPPLRRVA